MLYRQKIKKGKVSQSKMQSSQYKALYQGTKHPRLDKEVPLTSQHASVDSGRKSGWKCWQRFLNNLISGKRIRPRLSCILPYDSRVAFLTFIVTTAQNTIFIPIVLLSSHEWQKRQISSSPMNWSGRIIRVNWHASPVKFTDSPPPTRRYKWYFLILALCKCSKVP